MTGAHAAEADGGDEKVAKAALLHGRDVPTGAEATQRAGRRCVPLQPAKDTRRAADGDDVAGKVLGDDCVGA